VSQRGSHAKLRGSEGRTVIVPNHREVARGTMRSILRPADLTVEEFERLGGVRAARVRRPGLLEVYFIHRAA
jgi:hypothetical protein